MTSSQENCASLGLEQSIENLNLTDSQPVDNSSTDPCTCLHDDLPTDIEDETQLATIRNALNQQTDLLYKQYAQEQHPKEPEKQRELILEMQEQYFVHYLSEIHRSQLMHQHQQLEQLRLFRSSIESSDPNENKFASNIPEIPNPLPLIPATIWTKKDIAKFKREILDTQRECCIKIGSLATATIRVPTHPEGSAIFWEFATDHYDLGFGLFFEWDLEAPENITVSISESSDDEDEDEDGHLNGSGGGGTTSRPDGDSGPDGTRNPAGDGPNSDESCLESSQDLERGRKNSVPRLPTDELIPIYRRDCHTEVFCGSHQYPGIGVYVFKFDNSFSLWRSKWLYYRIFYTH